MKSITKAAPVALPDALHLEIQVKAFSDGDVPVFSFPAHAENEVMLILHVLVVVRFTWCGCTERETELCGEALLGAEVFRFNS